MKKFKFYLLAAAGAAILVLGGCKEKEKYDETAFEDDLEPLTDEEVEAMDNNTDEDMVVEDEAEMNSSQGSADKKESSSDSDDSQSADASQDAKKLDEKGTYTDKDEVAQYIYEYGHAPSNLTAEPYDNAGNMLPVEDGVTYQQCSLDAEKKQKIIFTQDGKRVYYTEDDGNSFDEIY